MRIQFGAALLAAASVIAAEPGDFTDRPTNPAMQPIAEDSALPRVLLIGDSISIGYTVAVRRHLAGTANVHRIPGNGGSTTNGLAQLGQWLGTNRWDVIHFNFGLHDLKITTNGQHLVVLEKYEKNLAWIVRRLKQTGASLIWASTTPIPAGRLNPPRKPGDELNYNAAARRVMESNGVAIDDLHAFILPAQARAQLPGNVHFTPRGSEMLAGQVARSIQAALRARASRK